MVGVATAVLSYLFFLGRPHNYLSLETICLTRQQIKVFDPRYAKLVHLHASLPSRNTSDLWELEAVLAHLGKILSEGSIEDFMTGLRRQATLEEKIRYCKDYEQGL